MNLAQPLQQIKIDPSFLESLGKFFGTVGPYGLLIIVILGFIYLFTRLNNTSGKANDNQKAIVDSNAEQQKAVIGLLAQFGVMLTKQNDRMDKYDSTVDIMAKGIDKQNELLDGILSHQQTGNDFSRRVFEELIAISGDQGTAITAVGQTVTETVKGSEALIMSRLDGIPERVASRLTPALATQHTETLQKITNAGKSIEDLFKGITQENINLRDEVELKTQTITSLTTRLETAEKDNQQLTAELTRLRTLTAPSDFVVLSPVDGKANRDIIDAATAVISEKPEEPKS